MHTKKIFSLLIFLVIVKYFIINKNNINNILPITIIFTIILLIVYLNKVEHFESLYNYNRFGIRLLINPEGRKQLIGNIKKNIDNVKILKINSVGNTNYFDTPTNSKYNFYNNVDIFIPNNILKEKSLLEIITTMYNGKHTTYNTSTAIDVPEQVTNVDNVTINMNANNEITGFPYNNRYTKYENTIFNVTLTNNGITINNNSFQKTNMKQTHPKQIHSTFEYTRYDKTNLLLVKPINNTYENIKTIAKKQNEQILNNIFIKYDFFNIKGIFGKTINNINITFTINNDFNNYHYPRLTYTSEVLKYIDNKAPKQHNNFPINKLKVFRIKDDEYIIKDNYFTDEFMKDVNIRHAYTCQVGKGSCINKRFNEFQIQKNGYTKYRFLPHYSDFTYVKLKSYKHSLILKLLA